MNPFYFGDSEKQLFGVYHPSKTQFGSDRGIVLCPPIGREYMRTHWAFRQLADLLSKKGYHVLRFDYYAVGDSAGNSKEGNVTQWKKDINTAVNELRDISGSNKISLVGLRLGAALAAEATTESHDIENLVLWDPVVNGRSYISRLKQMHRKMLLDMQRNLKNSKKQSSQDFNELLGYPFPLEMQIGIEKLNLFKLSKYYETKVFLIVSEENVEYLQLAEGNKNFVYSVMQDDCDWYRLEDMEDSLFPHKIMKTIVEMIAEP